MLETHWLVQCLTGPDFKCQHSNERKDLSPDGPSRFLMDLLVSYTFIGREELLQKCSSVSQFRKTAALRHRLWSHRKLSHLGNMLYILLCCMRSEPQQTRDNRALQTQEQPININSASTFIKTFLHCVCTHPWICMCTGGGQMLVFDGVPHKPSTSIFFLSFIIIVCVMGGRACASVHTWRSEDNFVELVLSHLSMGSGYQTQVFWLVH